MYAKSTLPVDQLTRGSATNAIADLPFDRISSPYRTVSTHMSVRLQEIQESERQRIATDLHDGLGQSLTMIKHAVDESVRLLKQNGVTETLEMLEHLKCRVCSALNELHSIALDLRPAMLDDLGIRATLSWFFREFEADCHKIRVTKNFRVKESSVPAALRIVIFRIIQEAVSNVVKHAHASRMYVTLEQTDNALHLSIEDNGRGFDILRNGNARPFGKGLGMLTMAERAKCCGGRYLLSSAVGQGTRIEVTWPLDQVASKP